MKSDPATFSPATFFARTRSSNFEPHVPIVCAAAPTSTPTRLQVEVKALRQMPSLCRSHLPSRRTPSLSLCPCRSLVEETLSSSEASRASTVDILVEVRIQSTGLNQGRKTLVDETCLAKGGCMEGIAFIKRHVLVGISSPSQTG